MLAIMKSVTRSIVVFSAVILTGCAATQDMTGSYYNRGEHRQIQSQETGVIVDARQVTLNTAPSTEARTLGAVLGGAVAGLAVRNSSSQIAQIAGAVLGIAGGERAASYLGQQSREAAELVVKLDTGRTAVVVQEMDPKYVFRIGDRVRIIEGREARVAPVTAIR